MTNETKNTSGKTSIAGRKPRSGKKYGARHGKAGREFNLHLCLEV